eukprot:CAMPEP_0168618252 /NCGR_PEP_ID=MMETSP0449_2-20121227/5975_1 /TAXON_ID=1082188 /ORGANISM="Strombidium rassoulzadegani, Strain ras09" /LENGTH=35 /DNA_ID= /DNA_START= /DNA_END= /DNA_ORIENTATION=
MVYKGAKVKKIKFTSALEIKYKSLAIVMNEELYLE